LSDSKIFNDTESRAACLRQLSYLFIKSNKYNTHTPRTMVSITSAHNCQLSRAVTCRLNGLGITQRSRLYCHRHGITMNEILAISVSYIALLNRNSADGSESCISVKERRTRWTAVCTTDYFS